MSCYDRHPTLDHRDPEAYAKYARRLDEECPGWWADDVSRMDGELAAEAMKRRSDSPAT